MVKTRFAPSPSGFLHIGGIRTAIFNWAYARKHGGMFILRIDDTDKAREVDNAIERIKSDFQWLGLDYDQMVFQSERRKLYDAAIAKLLIDRVAYKDDEGRIKFDVQKYGNMCGRHDKPAILMAIDDLILGRMEIDLRKTEDFSIARSDGTPLYNLATAVDDYELGITHVIRGQEHITNTYPQQMLTQALGYFQGDNWPAHDEESLHFPGHIHFAHVPFICAPNSNKKLSKRDDINVTLDRYRNDGYTPDAVFNYLSHLGWAMDGKTEKWTRKQFVEAFDFPGCNKKPAHFDPKKFHWLQGEYLKEMSVPDKVTACARLIKLDFDHRYPFIPVPNRAYLTADLEKIIQAAGDRLKTFGDIRPYKHFLLDQYLLMSLELIEEKITPHRELLNYYTKLLEAHNDPWIAAELEKIAHTYCDDCESGDGIVNSYKGLVHALRAATTGQKVGFGLFEGMEILGKDRTIKRIKAVL